MLWPGGTSGRARGREKREMTYHVTLLAVLFAINAYVVLLFTFFGFSRRYNPGGTPFILLMLAVGEWSLTGALEAAVVEVAGKIFWAKFEYLGITTVGLLWLVFALAFTRRKEWLSVRRLIMLGIIPLVTIAMAFTNELHGLIWTSITPDLNSPYGLLIYRHGAWFWVIVAYNYATFTAGTVLLLNAFRLYTRSYRFGIGLLVCGALLPLIGNALYLTGLSPLPGLDLTHFGFTGAAVVFSMTIFRYKIFDLRSFARDIMVEQMSDGFVVMDGKSRIIDVNPAAARIFGSPAFHALGLSVEEAAIRWSELADSPLAGSGQDTQVILGDRVYRMGSFPLTDRGKRTSGRVLTIRDVGKARSPDEAQGGP
jgi:PAS domain-containing protein